MSNYYIADLHIGHANVISYDNRPFADVDEMNQALVNNWNSVVTDDDTVYVLGDFIWGKEYLWEPWLKQLSGKKNLILGNHDPHGGFSKSIRKHFHEVTNLLEIKDSGYHVIMCHYAIPFHRADYATNCYMLYGHVHNTREYDYLVKLRRSIIANNENKACTQGNFINVGCMMPWMNYTPRTIEEIITGDKKYRCPDAESIGSRCKEIFERYSVRKAILLKDGVDNFEIINYDIVLLVDAPLRGLDYFGFVADLEEELNLRISVKLASSIDDQNIIRKRITESIRVY